MIFVVIVIKHWFSFLPSVDIPGYSHDKLYYSKKEQKKQQTFSWVYGYTRLILH